jgi:hypothetical protein
MTAKLLWTAQKPSQVAAARMTRLIDPWRPASASWRRVDRTDRRSDARHEGARRDQGTLGLCCLRRCASGQPQRYRTGIPTGTARRRNLQPGVALVGTLSSPFLAGD